MVGIPSGYTREREREREWWHGILFEEPNPEREPPTRPNWALEDVDTGNPTPPEHTRGSAFIQEGNRAPVTKATTLNAFTV